MKPKGYDMPREDFKRLNSLDIYERTVAYNWQFALAESEYRKFVNFLESLGCDIEVYLYDDCEDDDEEWTEEDN